MLSRRAFLASPLLLYGAFKARAQEVHRVYVPALYNRKVLWSVGDSNVVGHSAVPGSFRAYLPGYEFIGTQTDSAGYKHDGHDGFAFTPGIGLGSISSIPVQKSDLTVLWAGTNDAAQHASDPFPYFAAYAARCIAETTRLVVIGPVLYARATPLQIQACTDLSDQMQAWCIANNAGFILGGVGQDTTGLHLANYSGIAIALLA